MESKIGEILGNTIIFLHKLISKFKFVIDEV